LSRQNGDGNLKGEMLEYLSFFHSHGAGVPPERIAKCFGITLYDVEIWADTYPAFKARVKEIVESWPDELLNSAVPFNDTLLRWLTEWEETGKRRQACKLVGCSWARIAHAIKNSPPFRGQVKWIIDEGLIVAEDLVLESIQSGDSTSLSSAKSLLKAKSTEWQTSLKIEGEIKHSHTHGVTAELRDSYKGQLEEKMALLGEATEVEVVEL